MEQSKIIQSLCNFVDDKKIIQSEEYQNNLDEVIKWNKIMNKYFREGFLCGARLALEICGFEKVYSASSGE